MPIDPQILLALRHAANGIRETTPDCHDRQMALVLLRKVEDRVERALLHTPDETLTTLPGMDHEPHAAVAPATHFRR